MSASAASDPWGAFVVELVAAVRAAASVGTGEEPLERRARLEAVGRQLEQARQHLEDAADTPAADDEVRARLGRLVDALEALQHNPLVHVLATAPSDDEPVTAEDLAAIHDAEEDLESGRVLSTDELRRQLGLG